MKLISLRILIYTFPALLLYLLTFSSSISAYSMGKVSVLRLYPTFDTYVYSGTLDYDFNPENRNLLFLGYSPQDFANQKVLLNFDLRSVPNNATILYSNLGVYVAGYHGINQKLYLNFFESLVPSTVKWNSLTDYSISTDTEIITNIDAAYYLNKYYIFDTYQILQNAQKTNVLNDRNITLIIENKEVGPEEITLRICSNEGSLNLDYCIGKSPYLDITYYVEESKPTDKFDLNSDSEVNILDILHIIRKVFS